MSAKQTTPKYQSIALDILRQMQQQPEALAKPQRVLSAQFGVNRLTVQRSLGWLEQQGKIALLPNRGYALVQAGVVRRTGRIPKIGFPLWTDSFAEVDFFNSFWRMKMAEGAHIEAARLGCELDIQCVGTARNPNFARIEALMREWDAVILEPIEGENDFKSDHPFSKMLPQAALVGAIEGRSYNCICPDFYKAAELAVATLRRSGLKTILYSGCEDESISHLFLRIVGLEKSAGDVRLLFANGGHQVASAFSTIKRFFLQGGKCDAIITSTAPAAMGAARAIGDMGLRMPEDIQLLSIGNSTVLNYMVPRPTVIDVADEFVIGKEAARLAAAIARGAKPQPNVLLPMQLVAGETTFASLGTAVAPRYNPLVVKAGKGTRAGESTAAKLS